MQIKDIPIGNVFKHFIGNKNGSIAIKKENSTFGQSYIIPIESNFIIADNKKVYLISDLLSYTSLSIPIQELRPISDIKSGSIVLMINNLGLSKKLFVTNIKSDYGRTVLSLNRTVLIDDDFSAINLGDAQHYDFTHNKKLLFCPNCTEKHLQKNNNYSNPSFNNVYICESCGIKIGISWI